MLHSFSKMMYQSIVAGILSLAWCVVCNGQPQIIKKVEGDWKVTAYEKSGFRGDSKSANIRVSVTTEFIIMKMEDELGNWLEYDSVALDSVVVGPKGFVVYIVQDSTGKKLHFRERTAASPRAANGSGAEYRFSAVNRKSWDLTATHYTLDEMAFLKGGYTSYLRAKRKG